MWSLTFMTIFIKINYNFIFKLKKLKIIFLQKGCRQPRSHGLPDHPSPVKDANIMDMTMCKTMVKESCKETNKSSTSFFGRSALRNVKYNGHKGECDYLLFEHYSPQFFFLSPFHLGLINLCSINKWTEIYYIII